MMSNEIIEVRGLSKDFDPVLALRDVTLSVNRGESVALLGANGAGKSTLINLLLGFLDPTAGSSRLFGVPSRDLSGSIKDRLYCIADHASPFPWASAWSISRLYASLYTRWRQDIFERYMERWRLDDQKKLAQLSKGQRRLAEITLAMACSPELLLLDEPFNGLDSVMRIQVQKLFRKFLTDENGTIFYTTHILSEVDTIARRIVILKKGEVAADILLEAVPEGVEKLFVSVYGLETESHG